MGIIYFHISYFIYEYNIIYFYVDWRPPRVSISCTPNGLLSLYIETCVHYYLVFMYHILQYILYKHYMYGLFHSRMLDTSARGKKIV